MATGGNGALVPGYPAINKPFVNAIDVNGGVYSIPVTATEEGYAAATVTIGGTITTSDTLTVTINGHAVTYTVVSGDTTLTLLATHVKNAINSDGTDSAIVLATSGVGTVTITALAAGAAGTYTLAVSKSAGATETIAASSPELVLGGGTEVVPISTFQWDYEGKYNNRPFTLYKGFQYTVDITTANNMRAAGLVN